MEQSESRPADADEHQDKPQPRDERSFETTLAINTTPNWLPGVRLNMSFRRIWDKRMVTLVEQAALNAGVSVDTLVERVEADEDGFPDLFERATTRARERGDPFYRDALAKLVGAALRDSARIDTISYVVDRILPLEPIHLRVISLLPYGTIRDAISAGNPLAKLLSYADFVESGNQQSQQRDWDHDDRWDRANRLRTTERTSRYSIQLSDEESMNMSLLARIIRSDTTIATACVQELHDARFLSTPRLLGDGAGTMTVVATEMGLFAANMINGMLE